MDLNECRKQIDNINDEILELFLKRMDIATAVADYKKANNLPIMQQSREEEILEKMSNKSGEELGNYSKILFSTIMNLSRCYQATRNGADPSETLTYIKQSISSTPEEFPKYATVACQGIKGAYSQIACNNIFSEANIHYFKTFDEVFGAIENGICQYGVLPIENCLHGSVNHVYDLMKNHNFFITKGIKLKINHTLLGKKDSTLSDITDIYSHEQAIGQCSEFLKNNPNITVHICENTAVAAKIVSDSDNKNVASISSPECAAYYDLECICQSIANSNNNYTRFICISKNLEIYKDANKISLLLQADHKPGALFSLISRFAALGLNITKLESRPIVGRDFEYLFYFDVEGSIFCDKVMSLISELCGEDNTAVFLGSYLEL